MAKIEATVKIRRGDAWQVRPEAEKTDGMRHTFTFGWIVEAGIYAGEQAWIADRDGWPEDAPPWVASGDLRLTR